MHSPPSEFDGPCNSALVVNALGITGLNVSIVICVALKCNFLLPTSDAVGKASRRHVPSQFVFDSSPFPTLWDTTGRGNRRLY